MTDYKIPLMSDIECYRKNGYKVVSTFSGCGGSCLGYEMTGYTVLWANEFIKAARETYCMNHDGVILDGRDIREVKGSDILNAIHMKPGELDVFEGSPPCSEFSMAGKRRGGITTLEHKGWGHKKKYSDSFQQVDDLFFEYARLLNELQPKMFQAENVKGLTLGHAKDVLGSPQIDFFDQWQKTIFHTLTACGYNVKYKVLNAWHYGVPQARERLIIIGVRNDIKIEYEYPKPVAQRFTLRDALEGLTVTKEDLEPTELKGKTLEIVQQLKPGQSGAEIMDGSYFSLKRLEWNEPAGTIQQSEAKMASTNQIHPDENRRLSIKELKRVGSFPDDFYLTGTFAQQWERIGRAVPPIMMAHIAASIRTTLNKMKEGTNGS